MGGQASIGVHMANGLILNMILDDIEHDWMESSMTHIIIIIPSLVATHAVASDQLNWSIGTGRVQAVVVRHDLLSLGVGKDLVASQAMAIGQTQILATLSAHGVEAIVGGLILDLKHKMSLEIIWFKQIWSITDLSEVKVVQRHLRLWIDVLKIPSKALALELLTKQLPGTQITNVNTPGTWFELALKKGSNFIQKGGLAKRKVTWIRSNSVCVCFQSCVNYVRQ